MKILLFGDAHCCKRSSIINKFGCRYSVRLENQIRTFGWIKEQALKNNCDMVIGLGDLFDSSQLSDMEITAANDLPFADLPTYLIVGNHEASSQDLTFSSTKLLEGQNRKVISEPFSFYVDDTEICLLPYITESERKLLAEYFPSKAAYKKRVILSHNDIKGISYGPVISTTGFDILDIKASCDLYINAHIHNGQQITEKIYNIGNVTGLNFSEDASKYTHNVAILDTATLKLNFIENPHAYNFYKIQIDTEQDLQKLSALKSNAVVSIKCPRSLLEQVRARLEELREIILESRIILVPETNATESTVPSAVDLTVDHLAKFVECCKATLENSTILEEELNEICK